MAKAEEEYTGILSDEEINRLFMLAERFVKAHESIASALGKIAAAPPAAAAKASASGAKKGTAAPAQKTGATQDDKKYITGFITNLRPAKQEGGFVSGEVEPTDGNKFKVWVGTKIEEQANLLTKAYTDGLEVKIGYVERYGNENPNKPGTRYKNRYVASVEPTGNVNDSDADVVDDDEEVPF